MELSYDGSVRPMSWVGMPEWQPPAHLAEPAPGTPRGEVVDLSIDSAALGEERAFQVYLPPGYEESGARYPVAYYHGGFAALPLGEIPKSLDNLIAAGQPPLIAVFMPPPPYTGLSIPDVDAYDRYALMWADEMVPLIDARFRTVAEPGARASLGGGAFGYFAAYAVFRHPHVATKLGMQSAAFNDWRRIVLESHVTDAGEQPLDVYLDWGSYDARSPQENWDNRDKNRRLTAFLRQHGYMPVGGEVADGAGWSSWKNRTDRVLATLFPPSRR
jgi:enterochelin esterase-like enzyme